MDEAKDMNATTKTTVQNIEAINADLGHSSPPFISFAISLNIF